MDGAIILAAGQGTRMKSKFPKVLHKVCGEAMLDYVLAALEEVGVSQKILVLGHQAELIQEHLPGGIDLAFQWQQLGTGHAVLMAREIIRADIKNVLVVCGDTPLLRGETLKRLLNKHHASGAVATVLTAIVDNASGYGRIIRQGNKIKAIVEEKDAVNEEKMVKEINTGAYCFSKDFILAALDNLTTDNSQKEYYLTDLIRQAVNAGKTVETHILDDYQEALGVNNRLQLAEADHELRRRKLTELMLDGVTIIRPETISIDWQVLVGADTVIKPFTSLEGKTIIAEDCLLGPATRIIDSQIGRGSSVENSVIKESFVGEDAKIGPFAYLRPGCNLGQGVKVGDFVEIKKSNIGDGSRIPHLSYVGDAIVGAEVNIGCGTITCNYDGVQKHQTIIKEQAFIGSNSNLIAPVTVGKGAYVGAGSTITKDVPDQALAVARGRQKNFLHWETKKKS